MRAGDGTSSAAISIHVGDLLIQPNDIFTAYKDVRAKLKSVLHSYGGDESTYLRSKIDRWGYRFRRGGFRFA